MVQTLLLLGYKTPAKQFLPEHEEIKKYNPKGYYELYHEVMNGVQHHRWKGQVVKLFPSSLAYTPPKNISKIIICKRSKLRALSSYKPLHKILGGHYSPRKAYNVNYKFLEQYIKELPHIFVTFEEITSDPEKVIKQLCEFLEIKPSKDQIENTIKNVEKK